LRVPDLLVGDTADILRSAFPAGLCARWILAITLAAEPTDLILFRHCALPASKQAIASSPKYCQSFGLTVVFQFVFLHLQWKQKEQVEE
jgi:hypothetical protein